MLLLPARFSLHGRVALPSNRWHTAITDANQSPPQCLAPPHPRPLPPFEKNIRMFFFEDRTAPTTDLLYVASLTTHSRVRMRTKSSFPVVHMQHLCSRLSLHFDYFACSVHPLCKVVIRMRSNLDSVRGLGLFGTCVICLILVARDSPLPPCVLV